MRQVAFAVPGRQPRPPRHPRGAGANAPPSHLVLLSFSWPVALLGSYGGNVHPRPPFSPVAGNLETPRSLALSGAGNSGGCGGRKSKMPPSPEL